MTCYNKVLIHIVQLIEVMHGFLEDTEFPHILFYSDFEGRNYKLQDVDTCYHIRLLIWAGAYNRQRSCRVLLR